MSVFLDKLDKDKVFLDKDKEDKEETTNRQRTTSLARRASTISAILAARPPAGGGLAREGSRQRASDSGLPRGPYPDDDQELRPSP